MVGLGLPITRKGKGITMSNEAFARVVIDTQLKDRGWNVHDQNSVRYEYVLPDSSRADYSLPADGYHVVLANPPFSGRVDKDRIVEDVKVGTATELLFLHADNDGYKLDANHDTPIERDDLPDLIEAYRSKYERWQEWLAFSSPFPAGEGPEVRAVWTQKWWFADTQTLRANDFNLSAGRYRPMNQAAVEHRDPRELLDELAAIENAT